MTEQQKASHLPSLQSVTMAIFGMPVVILLGVLAIKSLPDGPKEYCAPLNQGQIPLQYGVFNEKDPINPLHTVVMYENRGWFGEKRGLIGHFKNAKGENRAVRVLEHGKGCYIENPAAMVGMPYTFPAPH